MTLHFSPTQVAKGLVSRIRGITNKTVEMETENCCPHCGQPLENMVAVEEEKATPIATVAAFDEEQLIEKSVKIVTGEVMQKISPLLEKLNEIVSPEKAQEVSTEALQKQQLLALQNAAQERKSIQEKRIASRMQRIRNRISQHS